nr:MAG TPA: peroxin [Caudoviricetes sp.]
MAVDRPPVEVEPVERWRVFGFPYIMYRRQQTIRKR